MIFIIMLILASDFADFAARWISSGMLLSLQTFRVLPSVLCDCMRKYYTGKYGGLEAVMRNFCI